MCRVIYYVVDMGYARALYWPLLGVIGLMELPLAAIWYITMLLDTR